jgi:hypothetical protein
MFKTLVLEEGQFYRRPNGNYFRVIKTAGGLAKIRCVRNFMNGKPYTWQSWTDIVCKKVRKLGTEELLNTLARIY